MMNYVILHLACAYCLLCLGPAKRCTIAHLTGDNLRNRICAGALWTLSKFIVVAVVVVRHSISETEEVDIA